ncbi:MDR efflux pump AcrAB transcriptional activator RobA [Citrobacter sp. JGM124]|uniref:MDR efflux pump AcrAB transcriptional activator RobA n=1 Tax=Citrobacter sp. JGM124 TaxID=2799789 RepID=UPI001BA6ACEA|nr:MDR efflux pump AcrAB transcriptional activator RobA [Citrobacter sp. JGM124]MBS0848404.1 MDR efflux pump AcrAB transcriptional activator RobA [Citrobacter sp. JGM124]
MDQTGIIRDLLSWLESHLDKPLSIDNVAARAGYSKWHLQRMFKEVTGQAIGAYIRGRRLSKSAVALRLTARPILDIALQYRFDSQQTFTRAFKRQFAQTPACYRRSPEWSAYGICSPLRLEDFTPPEAKFITLPETRLMGTTRSYSCTLEKISDSRHEMRMQFWMKFLSHSPAIPTVLYGLHQPRPSSEKDDEQEIFYTTALLPESITGILPDAHPVILESGDYVQFEYEGPVTGLQEFILTVYGTCIPMLNLTRRQGQDIELFYPEKKERDHKPPTHIRCHYLIPIRH